MSDKKFSNIYDDDNIPKEDLAGNKTSNSAKNNSSPDYAEPLPESSRPRKDGPGGN